MSTLFEKIISREIPADIVFEDEQCIAFRDIEPKAPVHILLVPKKPIVKISEAKSDDAALLGHLMTQISGIMAKEAPGMDFRVVMNNGEEAGQSVFHLHLHLMAGRSFAWPPG